MHKLACAAVFIASLGMLTPAAAQMNQVSTLTRPNNTTAYPW